MFTLMETVVDKLLTELTKEVKHDQLTNVKDQFGKVSMDTIASCVFGVEAQSFENPNSEFIKQAKRTFSFTITDGIKFIVLMLGGAPIFK